MFFYNLLYELLSFLLFFLEKWNNRNVFFTVVTLHGWDFTLSRRQINLINRLIFVLHLTRVMFEEFTDANEIVQVSKVMVTTSRFMSHYVLELNESVMPSIRVQWRDLQWRYANWRHRISHWCNYSMIVLYVFGWFQMQWSIRRIYNGVTYI